jgi:hypothetical protein
MSATNRLWSRIAHYPGRNSQISVIKPLACVVEDRKGVEITVACYNHVAAKRNTKIFRIFLYSLNIRKVRIIEVFGSLKGGAINHGLNCFFNI